MITTLSVTQLQSLMTEEPAPLLIHVLPPDHFKARRLSGAINFCSYESAFISKIEELVPNREQPIILYGEGEPSLDSADAAQKLKLAGYKNISDFRGGLKEWEKAGLPILSDGPLPSDPMLDGKFALDVSRSVIRWTGRNLFNHHEGTLRFSEGSIHVREGVLFSGELSIDMNSIACSDLTDKSVNAMLIAHLRSADFFDTAHHPAARVTIRSSTPFPNALPSHPNHEISASLMLRGVERPLVFPAVIATADADHVTAQAQVEFDRTKFGSHYGSGRFFAYLGQHVVNDLIQLHLKIHAMRVVTQE
jgi:polyisoprenoid-binding protein YceI